MIQHSFIVHVNKDILANAVQNLKTHRKNEEAFKTIERQDICISDMDAFEDLVDIEVNL